MPLTADSWPTSVFIGFAFVAMVVLCGVAAGVAGASRTARFWLSLIVSILLAFGLLFGDGMLLSVDWLAPWGPGDAALFAAGVYLVPCSIPALLLGLFAGRAALRWILGTIAITGAVVIAIALLVLVSTPQSTATWIGVAVLMALTLLSGAAWIVLLRTGWLRDTGAPPWDLQKARSTFLGRYYLPSQEFPVTVKAIPVWGRPKGKSSERARQTTIKPLATAISPIPGTLSVSPDMRHVAWFEIGANGGYQLVRDGQHEPISGRPFAEPPVFSPNSDRLAYVSIDDTGCLVVGDAGPSMKYESVGTLLFSPDSRRLAYVGKRRGAWRTVLDGHEFGSFEVARIGCFSPDSNHLACAASSGGEMLVIVDEQEIGRHQSLGRRFAFSSDSRTLAYSASEGTGWHIVLGGKALTAYDQVGDPTFSAENHRFVYCARRDQAWFVVEDGQETGPFDLYMQNSPLFSPNGQRFAFAAESRGKWYVIVDGTPSQGYVGVLDRTSVFSPDSHRFAFAAGRSQTDIEVVVDNSSLGFHRAVGNGSLTFGPDSEIFMYVGQDRRGERVIFDGTDGPFFTSAGNIVPDPLEEGETRYAGGATLIFDSVRSFHYLAAKQGAIFLVEEVMADPGE